MGMITLDVPMEETIGVTFWLPMLRIKFGGALYTIQPYEINKNMKSQSLAFYNFNPSYVIFS